MKTQLYKIVLGVLLSVVVISCKKDFLEIVPKGNLVARTVADYDLLMNSYTFYNYSTALPALVLGDDVAAQESQFQNAKGRAQRAFQWQDVIFNESDVATDISTYLGNLYTCNKIIEEVMDATEGTETQKKSLMAEAMATRAWINFQFLNLYAKPYQASTASTDPGFFLVVKANVAQREFTRSTLQEGYDAVINDLTAAIPNLSINNAVHTRMGKAAAEAILGKVYLFMGKNAEALAQFNAALADNAISVLPARLYDYNAGFANPGGFFLPIGEFGPAYPGTVRNDFNESLLAKATNAGPAATDDFGNNGMITDPKTRALYAASDLRLKLYSATFDDRSAVTGGRVRKYAMRITRIGMQLQDLYLLRAEAKARLTDLSGAKADVEALRINRMPAADAVVPSDVAADQTAMIKFIIDERSREFAQEGYRWFDMRRLSLDPIFAGTTYTHTLYKTDGSTVVYTLRPERMVLKIPPYIINANPGITNNP